LLSLDEVDDDDGVDEEEEDDDDESLDDDDVDEGSGAFAGLPFDAPARLSVR
jgi:hypothetical protein